MHEGIGWGVLGKNVKFDWWRFLLPGQITQNYSTFTMQASGIMWAFDHRDSI